jgi:MFS transporter, OCT family, solute carrier family 22 (organic cation transporter), member 4/5
VLGSVTVTRIGDIYGRRPGFAFGLMIQSTVTFLVMFTDSYFLACVLTFFIGYGVTGKQYVGWNYLLEMQPTSKQIPVGVTLFIFEGVLFIFITTYFGWIGKHWQFMQIPTVLFGVIGILFLWHQPESPRFLVSTKRYDQARKSFGRIAAVNGVPNGRQMAEGFMFPKERANGN